MADPHFDKPTAALLERARHVCLSMPEATEKPTWGHPTFRVRDKIFASFGVSDEGAAVMTMKAAPGEQEVLLGIGAPFFMPAYVGSKGWIGIVVDEGTDWVEIAELVTDSYIAIAPKTLGRKLEEDLGS